MDRYDIIIIGAGISGLSLAHYCGKQGLRTLVIEKSERIGGTLHSHHFADTEGFWLELGAHTCYNSYRALISILEECNAIARRIPREKVAFKMLIDGRIKTVPFQLNFLELFLSAPRIFTLKKEGRSVESYYSRIIGRSNFERVLSPAMDAVISQRANDFPADMIFKKRSRRKDIMKKFTMAGGIQAITDSIAAQGKIGIVKGHEVLSIQSNDGSFRVATEGASYEADRLALATPASVAAWLLRGAFPELSERLSRIQVEPVESMGVAVRKDAVSLPQVAGIIPVSDDFFSVVSRDAVNHPTYRGFTFHFKPGTLKREAKLTRIAEVLGVKQEQLRLSVEKRNFIPALTVGHDRLIGKIDEMLSGGRLFLTGNYFDGLAIEDCVARSHKEFERLMSAPHGG